MLNNPPTNYVQRGEVIDIKNSGGLPIRTGTVVNLTTRIGIAAADTPVGQIGGVHVIGIFDIPAVTTEAFTVGQEVYWNGAYITSNTTSTIPAGWIVEPKTTSKAIARVKIG